MDPKEFKEALEIKHIPHIFLVTYESFINAKKELDVNDDEDPFTISDYINMIVVELANEGCINIKIKPFNLNKGTQKYLFMIKYHTIYNQDNEES